MYLNLTFRLVRHLPVCLVLIIFCAHATSARTKHAASSSPKTQASEETFNLSDFGAVGDGVADDGPALQLALDAIAEAGGGTLFIPAGTYFVATPVAKDFSTVPGATVNIQGVPSATMPAPPSAGGQELASGLNLTSEIIPATGAGQIAITLSNIDRLTIEDVVFTGREQEITDAVITLYLIDIGQATVRHCEFYGLSTFAGIPGLGGGNIIRAVRSELSIELSVFLGCAANSGTYAPIVENMEWRRFAISNSIFIDYGIRSFYGKMGLGAPLSWFNLANAAATTPESPRREVIVRDVFLDEGGWVGISVFPNRWGPSAPIDLIYISGLRMNVTNLATSGHLLYDAKNLLIENSRYGWSSRTRTAVDINGFDTAILDRLTREATVDRIKADSRTNRLTVINSNFEVVESFAQTTSVLTTTPEQDPVQYVRAQFVSTLGRQPDPAAHFYWSDRLIRCDNNADCLTQTRSALNQFLGNDPEPYFDLAGTVRDENGRPLEGATITLSGSQSVAVPTDSQGSFRFSGLPTAGSYTVTVSKKHYTFATSNQTITAPVNNVNFAFQGRLNRYSISGQVSRPNATKMVGVSVRLEPSNLTVTTDSNGYFSFTGVPAGGNYTVTPAQHGDVVFVPRNATVNDLSGDRWVVFVGWLQPELLTLDDSDIALSLGAVTFMAQPFSLFPSDISSDGFRRVIVFAKNVEVFANLSTVSMVAQDDRGQVHPIVIEFMGTIPSQSWLKQFNIKLPSTPLSAPCLRLTLSVYNIASNEARLCSNQTISPPNSNN